jgi:hypothetical protein
MKALATWSPGPRERVCFMSTVCDRVRVIASTHARSAISPLRGTPVTIQDRAGRCSGAIAGFSPDVFGELPPLLRVDRPLGGDREAVRSLRGRAHLGAIDGPAGHAREPHHDRAAPQAASRKQAQSIRNPRGWCR